MPVVAWLATDCSAYSEQSFDTPRLSNCVTACVAGETALGCLDATSDWLPNTQHGVSLVGLMLSLPLHQDQVFSAAQLSSLLESSLNRALVT